jgi:hypothetical protein
MAPDEPTSAPTITSAGLLRIARRAGGEDEGRFSSRRLLMALSAIDR